jgi:acyl dehydratase
MSGTDSTVKGGASKLPALFWEDFEIGDEFRAPWGRTITDAHVLAFSGVSGDFQHLHVDETYAKSSDFGTRIAHGPLTAVTALGMQVYTQVWRNANAFLEEKHEYRLPVRIGDTLFSTMTVEDVRETKKSDRGIVFFRNDVTNQDQQMVCVSHYVMMIWRRPADGAGSA